MCFKAQKTRIVRVLIKNIEFTSISALRAMGINEAGISFRYFIIKLNVILLLP